MPVIRCPAARDLVTRILVGAGAIDEMAEIVARHLVDADACGYPSHGLNLVPFYLDEMASGAVDGNVRPTIIALGPGGILVDGAGGFGQISVDAAVERLVHETVGNVVAVATFRRIGHIGRLAPYVESLSNAGRIGIMVAGFALDPREAMVAPTPGAPRLFGTNPIAMAFPGGPVLDLATSMMTVFGALLARRNGASLPEGAAVDAQGRATRDPAEVFDGGALLPMGEHKGAVLSMATCLLGALSEKAGDGVGGTLVIAINVAALIDLGVYANAIERLQMEIEKNNQDGRAAFRIPGSRAQQARLQAEQNGIPVSDELFALLTDRAERLGIWMPGQPSK